MAMDKQKEEIQITGYMCEDFNLDNYIKVHEAKWESQGIDDSCFLPQGMIYTKPFEGCKKVTLTLKVEKDG